MSVSYGPFKAIFWILLLLGCGTYLAGKPADNVVCSGIKLNLNTRLDAAHMVIKGRVVESNSYWDDNQSKIYTLHKILVFSAFCKNETFALPEIYVLTEGGTIGNMGRVVHGAVQLQQHQTGYFMLTGSRHYLTFLNAGINAFYEIYSGVQGVVDIENTLHDCWQTFGNSEQEFETRYLADFKRTLFTSNTATVPVHKKPANRLTMDLQSVSPVKILGGMGQVLTITGSGFGSTQGSGYVAFLKNYTTYHSSTEAAAFHYLSWTDSKITLEMPNAFSGKVRVYQGPGYAESSDTLHVMANVNTISYSPLDYYHLNNINGSGGHTWFLKQDLFNNPSAKKAVEDVFAEFRCKTGVNYTLENKSVWLPYKLNDAKNCILFDSTGYELPAGTAAYCEFGWKSCILGGQTFYTVNAQELRISNKIDWYYGTGQPPSGKGKLRYVLFHELGHSLQLGHVSEEGESMHPIVTNLPADNWNKRDTLTTADQEAGKYLVQQCRNFTFRACNVKPMLSLADCKNVYSTSAGLDLNQKSNNTLPYPNPLNQRGLLFIPEMWNMSDVQVLDNTGRQLKVTKLQQSIILESITAQIIFVRYRSIYYPVFIMD